MKVLSDIQKSLKVGKENRNEFGKYNYRNASDILEAVKPLLPEGYSIILSDDLVLIGDRYYVKATAQLTDGKVSASVTAFARESESKKGMDDSQITGSTSTYARKYALNGLFAIDDTKDADSMDNTDHHEHKAEIQYNDICLKHIDSLNCVRDSLAANDFSTAKEAWRELGEEVQIAIWKAPSKGGWFTTEERAKMRSNEWAAAQ